MLWMANTEHFCELVPGLTDTTENLLFNILFMRMLTTLFVVASILEGCAFLSGSTLNTLVPGLELTWQL